MYSPNGNQNDLQQPQKANPMDCNPVSIASQITWVKRCEWDTKGKRCFLSAGMNNRCSWHFDCARDGNYFPDLALFGKWFESQECEEYGWELTEMFAATLGEDDPYYECRVNFGGMRK